MKILSKAIRTALIDATMLPLTLLSALVLRFVRRIGLGRLKMCRAALWKVGVIPIRDHYYEPFFDKKKLLQPLSQNRRLPGIDWNVKEQVDRLDYFQYGSELATLTSTAGNDTEFHFNNEFFDSGDAEYWYSIVRRSKPRRIIEVGSGHSTKLARLAIAKNKEENPSYRCEHICIEPFEAKWLETIGVTVIREKVENVDREFFKSLDKNDILFIDSSHIIRPQGDVIFEYLELLPLLHPGVIVHIHDIFSPKDYCAEWVFGDVRLWNEQYLLEAFLTSNHQWKVIGSLNFLKHQFYEKLKQACPHLTPDREPNSFYMVKVC